MKLSISVPDDLWNLAAHDGESPSQVVQTALAQLVESRGAPEDRLEQRSESAIRRALAAGRDLYEIERVVSALTVDAANVRSLGYAVGLSTTGGTSWRVLESLPAPAAFRSELTKFARSGYCDLPDPFLDRLVQELHDYEQDLVDDDGLMVESPTLIAGIVDGVLDVRDVVAERLQGNGASSTLEGGTTP